MLEYYEQAIAQTARANYKAELPNVNFGNLPDIAKAVYYRKVEDDGFVMLRADFYQKTGELKWTLLKNRDGQYAIHHPSGKIARGGSFLRLFYLESIMNRPLSDGLERYALMNMDDVLLKNRSCTKITIRFPDNIDKEDGPHLTWITGMPPPKADKQKDIIPYLRQVFVDKETGAILSIRLFNEKRKFLREISLGNVTFNPDWSQTPDLFDTPPNPDFQVETLFHFRRLLHPPTSSKTKAPKTRNWDLLLHILEGRMGTYLFVCIAIVCLAGTFIARRKFGE